MNETVTLFRIESVQANKLWRRTERPNQHFVDRDVANLALGYEVGRLCESSNLKANGFDIPDVVNLWDMQGNYRFALKVVEHIVSIHEVPASVWEDETTREFDVALYVEGLMDDEDKLAKKSLFKNFRYNWQTGKVG